MAQVRLQKILAHAGIGSRRKCEKLIEEGHVSVNGRVVATLGSKADPSSDDIRFNGAPLRTRPGGAERKVYFLVNKPRGYICSNAGQDRKRVIDLVADHKAGCLDLVFFQRLQNKVCNRGAVHIAERNRRGEFIKRDTNLLGRFL